MESWLSKCVQCGSGSLRKTLSTELRTVGGIEFAVEVPALACAKCSEVYVDDGALEKVELAIATELGKLGRLTGDAFKFMRKALGLRAVDLAGMLDVTGETVSRWERGVVPIDHAAFAVLGALVAEKRQGLTQMRDLLEATRAAKLPSKPVRVVVSAA